MNAVDRAQLLQILQGRRDLIADSWHEAIAWSNLNSSSAPEARRHLVGLTDQVIALLLAERFEPLRAEAIGTSLVHHYHPQPETLARTQQTLGSHLSVQNLKGDRGVTFAVKLPTSRAVTRQKVVA